jgi:hypothetical protein
VHVGYRKNVTRMFGAYLDLRAINIVNRSIRRDLMPELGVAESSIELPQFYARGAR